MNSPRSSADDIAIYQRQGFGASLSPLPPFALLLVDFVVGFADPDEFGGGNILAAIDRSRTALAEARRRKWPVAHTRIVFSDDGSDANIFSRKVPTLLNLKDHDPQSQIVPDLAPLPGELIIRKTLPSAFAGTALQTWLTQKAVRSLVIAGCTTSGCVRASVLDAMNAGFVPVVLRDCVGDRAIGPHDANLFDMSQKYAEVMDLAELLSSIQEAQPDLPR